MPRTTSVLHDVEEARARQQGDRQEQRKEEVVLRVLEPRLVEREPAHPRQRKMPGSAATEAGERREKQGHLVIRSVDDEQHEERHERERADFLRAPAIVRDRRERLRRRPAPP